MKSNELVTVNNVTKIANVQVVEERVKKVCDAVEKAQDKYKSVMEDVYMLRKTKAYKDAGMNFADYMRVKTGMGKTTAYSLCAIWQLRLDNPEASAVLDKMSMRELLTAVKYPESLTLCLDTEITEDEKYRLWKEDYEILKDDSKESTENSPALELEKPDESENKEDTKEYIWNICNIAELEESFIAIKELLKNNEAINITVKGR